MKKREETATQTRYKRKDINGCRLCISIIFKCLYCNRRKKWKKIMKLTDKINIECATISIFNSPCAYTVYLHISTYIAFSFLLLFLLFLEQMKQNIQNNVTKWIKIREIQYAFLYHSIYGNEITTIITANKRSNYKRIYKII